MLEIAFYQAIIEFAIDQGQRKSTTSLLLRETTHKMWSMPSFCVKTGKKYVPAASTAHWFIAIGW